MRIISAYLTILLLFIGIPFYYVNASSPLLTTEENLWLKSKNNTITIIPERNSPPFSYSGTLGEAQGIFVDYINLIAKKFDIETKYLAAQTRIDVIDSLTKDKNDYIGSLGLNKSKELGLLATNPYFTTPVVIAVREDYDIGRGLTLDDFDSKTVSILAGSSTQRYVQINYPRVNLKEVVDNELALQKVLLAEVDAVVINISSLQHYVYTQKLKSIKVAGNIPGLDVNLAFVVSKDQPILRSILEKGLSQITPQEHKEILDKWQGLPVENHTKNNIFGMSTFLAIITSSIGIILFIWLLMKNKNKSVTHLDNSLGLQDIKSKINILKHTNEDIARELDTIEKLEKRVEEEVDSLK